MRIFVTIKPLRFTSSARYFYPVHENDADVPIETIVLMLSDRFVAIDTESRNDKSHALCMGRLFRLEHRDVTGELVMEIR